MSEAKSDLELGAHFAYHAALHEAREILAELAKWPSMDRVEQLVLDLRQQGAVLHMHRATVHTLEQAEP